MVCSGTVMFIVTATVTEETPYLSGLLAGVTVITLMTLLCGYFL